jgi:hypothetical protein
MQTSALKNVRLAAIANRLHLPPLDDVTENALASFSPHSGNRLPIPERAPSTKLGFLNFVRKMRMREEIRDRTEKDRSYSLTGRMKIW